MSVEDHGLEVLKKSAIEVVPGNKAEYRLRVEVSGITDLTPYVDDLETLLIATNALLTTIRDNADGLEGFTDGLESLLTQINSAVDGLEGFTDGLEGLISSTNTALTTANSSLSSIDIDTDNLPLIKAKTDNLDVALSTRATSANQVTANASLASIDAKLTSPVTVTGPLTNTQLRASEVPVHDVINASGVFTNISVTTTPAQAKVGASALSGRKLLIVTPTAGIVYYGLDNTVTTLTGTPIFKNMSTSFAFSDNSPIWLVAGSTIDTRIVEAA